MLPDRLAGRREDRLAGRGSNTDDYGRRHRPDFWLVILVLMLLAIGLVVVYSISPALAEAQHTTQTHYVSRQLIAIGLSIVAFGVMAKLPLLYVKRLYLPLLVLGGLATIVALLMPVNPLYPAHRWVRLGGFSFQSVELLKFAILVAAAGFFAERGREGMLGDWQRTIKPLLIAVGVLVIIVAGPSSLHAQSDLGSTAVILAMITVMAFVVGMPIKRLAMGAAILAIAVVLVVLPSPYRRARLTAFMHPDNGCHQASGYQACQALIAVGSGGIAGLGLGRSVQAYGYLPEAANDSIFAIYAEKFGFLGVTVLLGLMAALYTRLKNIAERAPDSFTRLLVLGVLVWLSVQAVINVGAMIGLLPLKGITLPFISYGGTSVVFAAAAVGMVFQISYYTAMRAPSAAAERRISGQRDSSGQLKGGKRSGGSTDGPDGSGYGRRQRGAYHPYPGSRA
jgi:cell division protein FtsW